MQDMPLQIPFSTSSISSSPKRELSLPLGTAVFPTPMPVSCHAHSVLTDSTGSGAPPCEVPSSAVGLGKVASIPFSTVGETLALCRLVETHSILSS